MSQPRDTPLAEAPIEYIDTTLEVYDQAWATESLTFDRVLAGIKTITRGLSKFVPTISTSIRYDDIREENNRLAFPSSNPTDSHYSTMLAFVNPTFVYNPEGRKWALNARYDYKRAQYFIDDDFSTSDHLLDVNWNRRLGRGQQLRVGMLYQNTHDRRTAEDTIVDFDSALDQNLEDYHRTGVSLKYQNGTGRSRTRYEAYPFRDNSETDYENLQTSSYDLDQTGIGGQYA